MDGALPCQCGTGGLPRLHWVVGSPTVARRAARTGRTPIKLEDPTCQAQIPDTDRKPTQSAGVCHRRKGVKSTRAYPIAMASTKYQPKPEGRRPIRDLLRCHPPYQGIDGLRPRPKPGYPVGYQVHHTILVHTEEEAPLVQFPKREQMKTQLFAPLGEAVLLSQTEERVQFKRLAGVVNAGPRDIDVEATKLREELLRLLMRSDPPLLEWERPLRGVHSSLRIPTRSAENVHYVRQESRFRSHSLTPSG